MSKPATNAAEAGIPDPYQVADLASYDKQITIDGVTYWHCDPYLDLDGGQVEVSLGGSYVELRDTYAYQASGLDPAGETVVIEWPLNDYAQSYYTGQMHGGEAQDYMCNDLDPDDEIEGWDKATVVR